MSIQKMLKIQNLKTQHEHTWAGKLLDHMHILKLTSSCD